MIQIDVLLDIASRSYISATTGCWLWLGHLDRNGYGKYWIAGRHDYSHRVAYERALGAIPTGLHIDHLCRNRRCANPLHLEAVTTRENTLRSPVAPSAINARLTECGHGHPFDETNTIVEKRGDGRTQRRCRTCLLSRLRDKYRLRNEHKGGG